MHLQARKADSHLGPAGQPALRPPHAPAILSRPKPRRRLRPQALVADSLAPGQQLSKMLADILLDSSGLTALDLSKNSMDDAAVAGVMDALRANEAMQIQARGCTCACVCARACVCVSKVCLACVWCARACVWGGGAHARVGCAGTSERTTWTTRRWRG